MVKTRSRVALVTTLSLLVLTMAPVSAGAKEGPSGYLTDSEPLVVLDPAVPEGGNVIAIIDSGDQLDGFTFEGIPDGIGLAPGSAKHTVDVYVNHEQSTVPFGGEADHQDSSVSLLTLSTKTNNLGAVLSADEAIGPEEGYIRFCSAFMATPADGFDSYVFFTGEESNDIIPVPPGADYGADPFFAPEDLREAGYTVALDTATGESSPIPGLGRLNHENTVVVGSGWGGVALMTTDDTFTAATSQLYLYAADDGDAVLADEGTLYAFQVTADENGPVDPDDPFNDANDYLDLLPGQTFAGRFIEVPEDVAQGLTDERPQDALENWSNDNNVFQFVRLEDIATEKGDPHVVYIADTGATRVQPNPVTGRMHRPAGVGGADNGRIFKFVLDPDDPLTVTEFSVMAQGDDAGQPLFVPFRAPDNIDTSTKSLMVQEDASNARIWQHHFDQASWRVVAHVTDTGGESSGIVDGTDFFGPGWWVIDVQAHSTDQMSEIVAGINIKREDGQLLLMKIPGS